MKNKIILFLFQGFLISTTFLNRLFVFKASAQIPDDPWITAGVIRPDPVYEILAIVKYVMIFVVLPLVVLISLIVILKKKFGGKKVRKKKKK